MAIHQLGLVVVIILLGAATIGCGSHRIMGKRNPTITISPKEATSQVLLKKTAIDPRADQLRKEGDLLAQDNRRESLEAALAKYEQALAVTDGYVEAHFRHAILLERLGRRNEAFVELTRVAEADPENLDLQATLAAFEVVRHHFRTADQRLLAVLKKNKRHALARSNIGLLYLLQEEYEQALKNFRLAIRFDPTLIEAYNGAAMSYRALRQYDLAQLILERGIEIEKRPELLTNLGLIRLDAEDHPGARQAFEMALQSDATYAPAHVNLAVYLLSAGDAATALSHLETAIKFDSEQKETLLAYGSILRALERYADAESIYNKILAHDQRCPEAYYNLGVLYETNGERYDQAMTAYDRAREYFAKGSPFVAMLDERMAVTKKKREAQLRKQKREEELKQRASGAGENQPANATGEPGDDLLKK